MEASSDGSFEIKDSPKIPASSTGVFSSSKTIIPPSPPAVEKGPVDMASEESEKVIADSEEEEDKTPPRKDLCRIYNDDCNSEDKGYIDHKSNEDDS